MSPEFQCCPTLSNIQVTPVPDNDGHQFTILGRGITNGKLIWSGRAFEGGTRKSSTGSPTVYCRTRSSFGKLRLKRAANYDMRFTSVKQGETRVLPEIFR